MARTKLGLLLSGISVLMLATCLTASASKITEDEGNYLIGTGIHDMTGPAAQINFMGYAKSSQTAHGIHLRLRARAFIMSEFPQDLQAAEEEMASSAESMEDQHRSLRDWNLLRRNRKASNTPKLSAKLANPDKTVCFVSIDAGMGSDLLNTRVVKRLEELMPPQEGESGKRLCHLENLSISGTHTHSGPAGFLQYTTFQVTSYGFSEETMGAFVEGVAQAIYKAYNNLEQGTIETASDLLFDANINRSPSSYLLNPKEERDLYPEGDTDKSLVQLKFTADSGNDMGVLNWFSVHGTSMNGTNQLISGDNKGYASYLVERHVNGNKTLPGKGPFVAAFASTNLGDVSPNTAGPRCLDSGLPCDVATSTCNGKSALCVAFGPGQDMFESTEIIGRKQYELSLKLFHNASARLQGPVDYRHAFIDMSNQDVVLDDGSVGKTCTPALGYSFAAGTTDGIGDFSFQQGTNTSNPFWNMISSFISKPTDEQIACHAPKPILLNIGNPGMLPYQWEPNLVPISIFRVGALFVLNVPGEFTTMAGRRLRRAVKDIVVTFGVEDPTIAIAGLANSYTHYITTEEEYQGQRYEAASTIFGPHTLRAYIQEFERITKALMNGEPVTSQSAPPDLSKKELSLIPPVVIDTIGIGKKFGSVAVEAEDEYVAGKDTVVVSFRSANPRNNQRIEDTFLTVDKLGQDGSWSTVFVDGDWCTRFIWKGSVTSLGISFAQIEWDIPVESEQGLYRICHYGTRKTIIGDSEEPFVRTPDWVISSNTGSTAVASVVQAFRYALAATHYVHEKLSFLGWSRYRDFSGCSKTFLVRATN